MPHGLILGMTTSGKTHFARSVARSALAAGRGVIVLHKPREPWLLPRGRAPVFETADPLAFLDTVKRARSCLVFAEMADARYLDDTQIDREDTRFHALATDSRHEGHEVFFLAQRCVSISPTIRENCSRLWCFRVGLLSAKKLAEEFTDPELLKAPEIPLRWFYAKPIVEQPAQLCPPLCESATKRAKRQQKA